MGLLAKGRVALQKGIVFRENLARNQGWCTISLAFSTLVARDLTFLPILDKMNTLFSVEQKTLHSGGKQQLCGYGGIGRRARFRIWCLRRAGSSPVIRIELALENAVNAVFSRAFLLTEYKKGQKRGKL